MRFEEFYAASATRVLGHVHHITGNRTEAEDAVAEAYARAWQRWSTVRTYDSPEAWVRRVATRIAVSGWRKTVNRHRAHHRDAATSSYDEPTPDHVALVHALRTLPAAQRRDIVMHHLLDMSVADIAAETGTATGTVKARLARGRKSMAAMLHS